MNVDSKTKALQDKSTEVVLRTHVEPKVDMFTERQKATFDVTALKYFMNGGENQYNKKLYYTNLLKQKEWADKSQRYFQTRKEEYVSNLESTLNLWDFTREHNLNMHDSSIVKNMLEVPSGLEVHLSMFIPTLMTQASDEQKEKWLPLVNEMKMIGAYAQTELGHGSFVRGLQTTATFDMDTDEFIIHSPVLSATKWWAGGLGKTATHAVVVARLFIHGRDYGPHIFLIQLRNLEDHKPLPGITVGDIGPKFGYNGVDNGFLSFEYVRIPRTNMLMRYSKVTREGVYISPPEGNDKAAYATMMYVRVLIVKTCGKILEKALTIAVRYAAVRRQTAINTKDNEFQILDYQNVSGTLLPLVATAYAFHFTGLWMNDLNKKFNLDRDKGNFSLLPELHVVSSCLKAMLSEIAVHGAESCRICCGGHGYSKLSGLPDLYSNQVQNLTWEGDNNVLYLQTGRYLLKCLLQITSNNNNMPINGSASYLQVIKSNIESNVNVKLWMDPMALLYAFQYKSYHLTKNAYLKITSESDGKIAFSGESWNNSTNSIIKSAKAHAMCIIMNNFINAINLIKNKNLLSIDTIKVLEQCLMLFGISHIELSIGDLLECNYIIPSDAMEIRKIKDNLLKILRPNAVALVDAFGLTDYDLNSALGKEDGDVYKDLLERAKESPLNETEEGPGWPLLKQKMLNISKL